MTPKISFSYAGQILQDYNRRETTGTEEHRILTQVLLGKRKRDAQLAEFFPE